MKNTGNNFLDKHLMTIVVFAIVFVVVIFFAEIFLVYDKLGAYSNLIVAFTSVCAILIAIRQGEINLRILRIDSKINSHNNLKIALFSKRIAFISELRMRFEKIEEIILKVWKYPPEIEFEAFNSQLLDKLKLLDYKLDSDLKKDLFLKINDLHLFVKQNQELLSFEVEEIDLSDIDDFISQFKTVIYFLSSVSQMAVAIDCLKSKNLPECNKYIRKRILDQEDFNYLEDVEEDGNPHLENEKVDLANLEETLTKEIQTSLTLVKEFEDKTPWREFKHLYELFISKIIQISKIQ